MTDHAETAATVPVRSIALLSVAAFASAATARVADPLLPQVAEEFGTSVASASVVATGFTLAYGLCQVIYGPIGDRFGKYTLIATMTLLSALGTGLAALAGDLTALGTLRLLSGATAAAIIPLSMAHIGDIVPYESRQPVLARFMSGQILGVIAGQACGGAFGEWMGWRGVFVALGAVYLAVAVLLWLELRSPRVIQARNAVSVSGLLANFAALARSPRVRLVLAVVFIEGVLFFGAFTFVGAFARDAYGLSYAAIGGMLAAFGVGALLYTTMAARVVATLGQRNMVLAGGVLLALAFAVFALTPASWVLPLPIALCGLGFYLFHNTLQTQATQMAPYARGVAVSLFASCFFLGQAAGVALAGPVAHAYGYAPLFLGSGLALPLLALLFRARM
ncbi:MAG TPA: MFS transporter [Azospirillum sp.]|nr:MFS transporter [Azospirillum sp.]